MRTLPLAALTVAMGFSWCCCCGSGRAVPVPVPETHAPYTGRWVCGGGDVHELRADGTYLRRRGDLYEPEAPVVRYDPAALTVDSSVSILGVRFAGDTSVALGALLDAENGQVCARIEGGTCAKVTAPVPPGAVGRWRSATGTLEVRSDGYVRIHRGSEALREGQLLAVGAEFVVQLCAPPLADVLVFSDGLGWTWDGEEMELVERDWDEKAVAAEAARDSTAARVRRSSGGGGGGGSRDHDFDFD